MSRPRSSEGSGVGALLVLMFQAALVAFTVATPLLGVWVASSLAAYGRTPLWVPFAAGALLFPVGPAFWELWARRRDRAAAARKLARGQAARPPLLKTFDRLILRTLALNLSFLGLLLWARPSLAFVALSTRGDWVLDGHSGPGVVRAREGIFAAAQGLEWLYQLSHENPFREPAPAPSSSASPTPAPTLAPTPSGPRPAPAPGSSPTAGSPAASGSVSAPAPSPGSASAWPVAGGLHPLVAAMPPEIEGNIAAMGAHLQRRLDDPMERARAVHDYVADRIAYDGEAYVNKKYPPQDAATVMRTRKGVCAGYSQLFAALGKAAGLDAVYVVGDTRTQSGAISGEGHAWNAVRVGQRWYLVDTTWDSGYLEGKEFHKKFRSEYLFTPPEVFGHTHLPDDARWQLRERPLSRGEFLRLPMLTPGFFADGLALVSPDRSQVDVQGQFSMSVRNPKGRHLLVSYVQVGDEKGKGQRCKVEGGESVSVSCTFAAPGAYNVNVFSGPEAHGSFAYVGKIQVNTR